MNITAATRKEKLRLRDYYAPTKIRFMKEGHVMGKKGDCWGILLTKNQLIETLNLWRAQTNADYSETGK